MLFRSLDVPLSLELCGRVVEDSGLLVVLEFSRHGFPVGGLEMGLDLLAGELALRGLGKRSDDRVQALERSQGITALPRLLRAGTAQIGGAAGRDAAGNLGVLLRR